jgi:hypothetical protein
MEAARRMTLKGKKTAVLQLFYGEEENSCQQHHHIHKCVTTHTYMYNNTGGSGVMCR